MIVRRRSKEGGRILPVPGAVFSEKKRRRRWLFFILVSEMMYGALFLLNRLGAYAKINLIQSGLLFEKKGPWNIAADFLVDMSFSVKDIEGMLREYESDHHTGMDTGQIAALLYDYTSGYPYLVSRLCMFMDERIPGKAWTKEGVRASVKMLLEDNNPLFQSLTNKLADFPDLNQVILRLLFQRQSIAYNADDKAVRDALMFGFVKIRNSSVLLANRIFEMRYIKEIIFGDRLLIEAVV